VPIATAATPAAVLPGTAVPNFPIQITDVQLNTVNQADVASTLHNVSADPVNLGNWIMLYGSYQVVVPATQYVTVAPGTSKTIHLASGIDAPDGSDIFLGMSSLDVTPLIIPNQVLVLLNPQRQLISAFNVPASDVH
jgi:hypothetical protein